MNNQAIRECTGPNGKPTVAQFCAFAVLADGRRVTTRLRRRTYCERLFAEWGRERISTASELHLGLGDNSPLRVPGVPILRET